MTVVCCQVDVSATSFSLVQRKPTERGVSACDREGLGNDIKYQNGMNHLKIAR